MHFKLLFTKEADTQLTALENNTSQKKRLQAVQKTLALMETNLRHPSLNTHKFHSIQGPKDEQLFESYAENKTPAAFLIFWYYGPEKNMMTILTITQHP
ncbi:MAG: hypothetical protein EXS67_01475 [Candidatus Margulisbacteria bacterium]|nr:hypothetical protein [Candidatus Margulisiibacteriota bacterium]